MEGLIFGLIFLALMAVAITTSRMERNKHKREREGQR